MSKYYIRFNPQHPSNRFIPPWQIIEIDNDIEVKRFYAEHVDLVVSSWTERAIEDNHYWNIACVGKLIETSDKKFKIVDENSL